MGQDLRRKAKSPSLRAAMLHKRMHDFEKAGRYYGRAFELHRGFYPRINELTLQFLRAALWKDHGETEESQRMLDDVRLKAQQMLADARIPSEISTLDRTSHLALRKISAMTVADNALSNAG